jgi:hypothetical protein
MAHEEAASMAHKTKESFIGNPDAARRHLVHLRDHHEPEADYLIRAYRVAKRIVAIDQSQNELMERLKTFEAHVADLKDADPGLTDMVLDEEAFVLTGITFTGGGPDPDPGRERAAQLGHGDLAVDFGKWTRELIGDWELSRDVKSRIFSTLCKAALAYLIHPELDGIPQIGDEGAEDQVSEDAPTELVHGHPPELLFMPALVHALAEAAAIAVPTSTNWVLIEVAAGIADPCDAADWRDVYATRRKKWEKRLSEATKVLAATFAEPDAPTATVRLTETPT